MSTLGQDQEKFSTPPVDGALLRLSEFIERESLSAIEYQEAGDALTTVREAILELRSQIAKGVKS